jgi:hypothetical protein
LFYLFRNCISFRTSWVSFLGYDPEFTCKVASHHCKGRKGGIEFHDRGRPERKDWTYMRDPLRPHKQAAPARRLLHPPPHPLQELNPHMSSFTPHHPRRQLQVAVPGISRSTKEELSSGHASGRWNRRAVSSSNPLSVPQSAQDQPQRSRSQWLLK